MKNYSSTVGGFILAAGKGRRIRPATLLRPKALLPFCGIPLLELTASYLESLELDGLAVNACYQADRIAEFCQRLNMKYNWDIKVSLETELLNHGGGLRKGIALLPDCQHILVHNTDIIVDYDLKALINAHLSTGADVTALLIHRHGQPNSVVLDEASGRIKTFRDIPHGQYTYTGIHIFNRDILKYLPDHEKAPDILECYHTAIAHGARVQGLCMPEQSFWSDIGTPQEYIRSHGVIADCALNYHQMLREAQAEQARRRFELETKGVRCSGALGLGKDLGVPVGSHLHNVVLWDYTRLPRPLLYADGIFFGNDVDSPAPVTDKRMPDKRIISALGLDERHLFLEPLPKQGSGRRYCRIRLPDGRTVVWSAYNPERRENSGFAAISDFLCRVGVRVPKVLMHLPDVWESVTEDLGQNDMQLSSGQLLEKYLIQAVEQVARLHVIGDQAVRLEELPLQPGFTKGLYDWERDYFRSNFLTACLGEPSLWSLANEEYCRLRTMMLKQPLVPIHRDLQSANIKVMDDKIWLIDFQGMRLGAAAYDLAALLYDPYQCHSQELRHKAWKEYCRCVRELDGTPPHDDLLPAAAIQRLMQALGAYGKLWLQNDLDWYRQFITPALEMLLAATCETDEFPGFRQLAILCRDKWQTKINGSSFGQKSK